MHAEKGKARVLDPHIILLHYYNTWLIRVNCIEILGCAIREWIAF
jgi:hypothetical protein